MKYLNLIHLLSCMLNSKVNINFSFALLFKKNKTREFILNSNKNQKMTKWNKENLMN